MGILISTYTIRNKMKKIKTNLRELQNLELKNLWLLNEQTVG